VVDVNINPRNPEVGTRSFGDDPEKVAEYGLAAMKGLQDGGMIATAKHFPGRGDAADDAHFETPTLNMSRQRLNEVELLPYRTLIKNGLDCIAGPGGHRHGVQEDHHRPLARGTGVRGRRHHRRDCDESPDEALSAAGSLCAGP
jgi:hypothetical protein